MSTDANFDTFNKLVWGRVVYHLDLGRYYHLITDYQGEAATLCDPQKKILFRRSIIPEWDLRCPHCLEIVTREKVLAKLTGGMSGKGEA